MMLWAVLWQRGRLSPCVDGKTGNALEFVNSSRHKGNEKWSAVTLEASADLDLETEGQNNTRWRSPKSTVAIVLRWLHLKTIDGVLKLEAIMKTLLNGQLLPSRC